MAAIIRTATETLLSCMEDFGESEPKECMVIYTNENGDMCFSSTTDSLVIKLGLLELSKQYILKKIAEDV